MGAGVSTEEKEANAWKTSSFPSGFSSFSCGSWSGLRSGSRKRGGKEITEDHHLVCGYRARTTLLDPLLLQLCAVKDAGTTREETQEERSMADQVWSGRPQPGGPPSTRIIGTGDAATPE